MFQNVGQKSQIKQFEEEIQNVDTDVYRGRQANQNKKKKQSSQASKLQEALDPEP